VNIENIKLIKLTSAYVNNADDPSYPYKLEANLRPPELMNVTFVMMFGGSDQLVVRGKTKAAIEEFIAFNDLTSNPRLRSLTITGPDDFREEIKKAQW
jgi:hypothetical protein